LVRAVPVAPAEAAEAPIHAEARLELARAAMAPLVVGLLALVLYRSTLLPGLGIWDTAEFQAVGPLLGVAHPTGYPSYVILGWMASIAFQPLGNPAFTMNFLSAALVAIAVGASVVLVHALTGRLVLAIAAGLGLAFSPIVWDISTRADPHALHLALLALILAALVGWEQRVRRIARASAGPDETDATDGGSARSADRWLVAAAILFGVSLGNHSLTLLLIPGVAAFVLAVQPGIVWERPRLVATCIAVIAATTALVYAELPLRAGILRAPMVYDHPNTWDGFRYIVTAEQFRDALVDPWGDLGAKLDALVRLLDAQLGPLVPALMPAFLVCVVRLPRWALLSGSTFVLTCFFDASYSNAAIDRYYLGPILFAWSWLAIGAGTLVDLVMATLNDEPGASDAFDRDRGARRRGLVRNVLAATASVVAMALLLAPTSLAFDTRWRAIDASADDGAQAWTDAALQTFARDAVVVSWWSFSTPLWYAQRIEGQRPDLLVIDDRTRLDDNLGDVTDVIDAYLGHRTIYLVRIDQVELGRLEARYRLEPVPMPPGQPGLRVAGRAQSAP
jgi:hypothetical protein